MDRTQCWEGRGLEGVEDRKKGPRCKRWENVREKFPLCPSFACSRFYLELYNRNCSERRPKRKTSFVKLSRVDISEKLIVLLPNHAGPQVTQVQSAQRLRQETHFTKVSGIQASFQWQTRLKYTVSLWRICLLWLHVLLTVNWRSKGRSLGQVHGICLPGIPHSSGDWAELHPAFTLEQPFIILLYFV